MNIFKESYFQRIGGNFQDIKPIFKQFILKYHYSKTIKGLRTTDIFVIGWKGRLMGVCVVGGPAGHKYNDKNVVEIRRLCTVNDAPKNLSSFFLGKVIRWLKKNTEYDKIITFADPHYGHEGITYKATNFKYLGKQKFNPVVYFIGDKKLHQRNFKQKSSDGKYTKNSKIIREGKAKRITLPKKHIYEFKLRRR